MPIRTDISKIVMALSMGIACLAFPSLTLGCERSGPLAVPFPDEWQPYFETLGPVASFKVREIEGSLESRILVISTDGKHTQRDTPLRKANLKLRNALSGEILRSIFTDNGGNFKLTNVPAGSYVLQIEQGEEPKQPLRIEGSVIIEVHTDAKELHLPLLALSMSDCGMGVHRKDNEDLLKQQSESTHAQTN